MLPQRRSGQQTTLTAFFGAARASSSVAADPANTVSALFAEKETPVPPLASAVSSPAPLTSSSEFKGDDSEEDDDVHLGAFLLDAYQPTPQSEPQVSLHPVDQRQPTTMMHQPALLPLVLSSSYPLLDEVPPLRADKRSTPLAAASPTRPLTQTTLDLGQRGSTEVGQRCPLCHMIFNLNADDVALHRRYCRAQKRSRRESGPNDVKHEGERNVHASSFFTERNGIDVGDGRTARGGGGAADQITSHKAVQLLEQILGTSLGTHSSNGASSSPAKKRARRGTNAATAAAASSSSKCSTTRSESPSFTCFQLPSVSSPASPHPLLVVMVVVRPPSSESSGALSQLLGLLGLAHHLWLPSGALYSGADRHEGNPFSLTIAFVVDGTLHLLLSAVVGQAAQREQDPELCVTQRDDGRILCGTRRHFTSGDVADAWQLHPSALRGAQKEWEQRTAASFASSTNALRDFFRLSHPSSSSPSSSSAAEGDTSGSAGDDVVLRLSQLSTGVAVYSVARWLSYGQNLCPFTQLSYARSVLEHKASSARTAVERAEGNVDDAAAELGHEMHDSLCAAAPLFADEQRSSGSVESATQPLYVHDDCGGDDADEWRPCDITVQSDREAKRRVCGSTPSSLLRCSRSPEAATDDGRQLSVVSYSSDA